tara:strand:- start:123 stop:392 length:270 start_codon:yes stop_codon:yes gene_type:complete
VIAEASLSFENIIWESLARARTISNPPIAELDSGISSVPFRSPQGKDKQNSWGFPVWTTLSLKPFQLGNVRDRFDILEILSVVELVRGR